MITKQDICRLDALDIETVAEALAMTVAHHKALCPFHNDRHPSLTFDRRKNRYRCFVCDERGGVIDLVMKTQGWHFQDSCKWLAQKFNIILSNDYGPMNQCDIKPQKTRVVPPHPPIDIHHLEGLVSHPVISDEAARFLYDERKISPLIVRQTGISSITEPVPMSGNPNGAWYNAPSLLIPYRDADDSLITVQARYLGHGSCPRFQFPRGSTPGIFNLPVLLSLCPGEELWIAEGVTDCLAMMSAGHKTIAIPSATLLKASDLETLRTLNSQLSTPFHMYPDADEPGERLFLELQKCLGITIHHHLLPSGFKDFGEWWQAVN